HTLTHTHIHTHTHAHTQHTHTHTHTHTLTNTRTHTLTCTHTQTHIHDATIQYYHDIWATKSISIQFCETLRFISLIYYVSYNGSLCSHFGAVGLFLTL